MMRAGRLFPSWAVGLLAFVASGCLTLAPPQATPGPTATPVTSPTPTPVATNRTYRVKSGDNLQSIAQRFGLTVGQLLFANPDITDANRIRVGQVHHHPARGSAGYRAALGPWAMGRTTWSTAMVSWSRPRAMRTSRA